MFRDILIDLPASVLDVDVEFAYYWWSVWWMELVLGCLDWHTISAWLPTRGDRHRTFTLRFVNTDGSQGHDLLELVDAPISRLLAAHAITYRSQSTNVLIFEVDVAAQI